jgi:diphosphomevalonate decarboxylase
MAEAVARANSNVALVKYWGKRNESLNLPYTGSISITLAGLTTTARAKTRDDRREDRLAVNGRTVEEHVGARLRSYLDVLRSLARRHTPLEVELDTNFPVAAGLASSASTFAALALVGSSLLGMELSAEQLSILARRGSGSAARSVHGGFVEWLAGELGDGSDSYAVQLAASDHWRVGLAIAITDEGPKAVGSGAGMAHSVKQSPFFPTWLEGHDDDLETIRRGILVRDLAAVGAAMEQLSQDARRGPRRPAVAALLDAGHAGGDPSRARAARRRSGGVLHHRRRTAGQGASPARRSRGGDRRAARGPRRAPRAAVAAGRRR